MHDFDSVGYDVAIDMTRDVQIKKYELLTNITNEKIIYTNMSLNIIMMKYEVNIIYITIYNLIVKIRIY